MASIDFMAIARGRRQAQNENWQDFQREQQAEEFQFAREERDIKRQQLQADRAAAAWLASSTANRQMAADAGVNAIDYAIQQREQTLANPEFQGLAPEVQNQILQKMQQSALLAAQTARDQGDLGAANRVLQAYGQPNALGTVQEAAFRGDVDGVLAASGLTADANGMVAIGGQLVPKVIAAQQIIAAGGIPGAAVGAAAQQLQNEALLSQQQTVAQQVARQQQIEQYNRDRLQLQIAGTYTPEQIIQLIGPDPRFAGVGAAIDSTGTVLTPMQQVAQAQQAAASAAPTVPLSAAQTAAVQAAGLATPPLTPVSTPAAMVQAATTSLASPQPSAPIAQTLNPLAASSGLLRLLAQLFPAATTGETDAERRMREAAEILQATRGGGR